MYSISTYSQPYNNKIMAVFDSALWKARTITSSGENISTYKQHMIFWYLFMHR